MNFKDFKKNVQFINEGVYDPGIFKAFFLAGGPGSGKTFVTQSAFAGTGLKVVNSDRAFEKGLRDANLSLKMPDEEEYFRNLIRKKAKVSTSTQLDTYVKGRLGLVIDATGRDYNVIHTQHNMLKQLGYDCIMIFVNTSLKVALERNKKRSRTIPDSVVEYSWKTVQSNIGQFQRLFAPSNFLVIDNNRDEQELVNITLNRASRYIKSQLNTKVNNYVAKLWISKQLELKKRI